FKFEVTAGNINDCVVGYEILQTLDIEVKTSWLIVGTTPIKLLRCWKKSRPVPSFPAVNIEPFNV
ncbi:hypothetical protein, partial [Paenibacillus larvae]|uniref:hypothetical protein n=1 Tax=Paenibacillus larvae TaxID=1464 RepID=UPI0023A93B39